MIMCSYKQTKFSILFILIFSKWNIVMDDWNLDEKSNKVKIIATLWIYCAQRFYKEWQIILGLHWMLVPLHEQFTFGIEWANIIGGTIYNI